MHVNACHKLNGNCKHQFSERGGAREGRMQRARGGTQGAGGRAWGAGGKAWGVGGVSIS